MEIWFYWKTQQSYERHNIWKYSIPSIELAITNDDNSTYYTRGTFIQNINNTDLEIYPIGEMMTWFKSKKNSKLQWENIQLKTFQRKSN